MKKLDSETTTYFNGVYGGSRRSAIFKGMRARENTIKLLMAAREKEFTELFPFRYVNLLNANPTKSPNFASNI